MTKIAIIINFFDMNNLSALPRVVFEIVSRNYKNFQFFVITNGKSDNKYIFKENITIYEMNSSIYSYKKLKRFIIENHIDIINFHGSLLGSIFYVKNLEDLKIPIILNIYDKKAEFKDFSYLTLNDFIIGSDRTIGLPFTKSIFIPACLIKHYLSRGIVKNIIVPSIRLKNYYQQLSKSKIDYIPIGIDFKKFSGYDIESVKNLKKSYGFDPDDKIIMYLGHSYITRGIDKLIQVLPLIKNNIPKVKLVLVLNSKWSSINAYHFIVDMVSRSICSDSIKIITKYVDNPEEYYAMADVLAILYRFPGEIPEYPLVILEAMAVGTPIITTDIGAIPEIINNNINGILVSPNDEEMLMQSFKRILLDDKFSKYIGKNAQYSVKSFDWNNATENTRKIYEECVI